MRILIDRSQIASAQAEFANTVKSHAKGTRNITIGFQSGNIEAEVLWLPNLGMWAYFGEPPLEKSLGERYWNVFGIGEPHGMVPITCEINPPKQGTNRQAAGAFAEDEGGSIYLLHRGILNVGGRVRKENLRRYFQWPWTSVEDSDQLSEVMQIGIIGSTDFLEKLRSFIYEVARYKDLVRH